MVFTVIPLSTIFELYRFIGGGKRSTSRKLL